MWYYNNEFIYSVFQQTFCWLVGPEIGQKVNYGQSIGNSASVCPPNEHSELMSFRIDWFDLLALQVTLKNFPQHQFESTNSLAFFMVQLSLWFTFPYGSLSHPSMDTGKNIALTRWTFIG